MNLIDHKEKRRAWELRKLTSKYSKSTDLNRLAPQQVEYPDKEPQELQQQQYNGKVAPAAIINQIDFSPADIYFKTVSNSLCRNLQDK